MLTRIVVVALVTPGRKKTSYMKLDVNELEVDNTKRKVDEAWKGHMMEGRDPRIN